MFPFYGFGGYQKGLGGGTSHCFPINRDKNNPEIEGIYMVAETYRNTLNEIGFSGPTIFKPLLEKFIEDVKAGLGKKCYQILLILTDGMICDMSETKKQIVKMSGLPASIIIVGVGNANFDSMEELDGDGGYLRDDSGNECERDIVQFVEYNAAVAKGDLAEYVLKEVPD